MLLISAFTMINSKPGFEPDIYKKILEIKGVKNAYRVIGVYDIILQIEELDLESLHKTIALQVRSIKEILSTLTLVIFS